MDRRTAQRETPQDAKDFFAGYLLPCKGKERRQASIEKRRLGAGEGRLFGLDCSQAGLVVAAFDMPPRGGPGAV